MILLKKKFISSKTHSPEKFQSPTHPTRGNIYTLHHYYTSNQSAREIISASSVLLTRHKLKVKKFNTFPSIRFFSMLRKTQQNPSQNRIRSISIWWPVVIILDFIPIPVYRAARSIERRGGSGGGWVKRFLITQKHEVSRFQVVDERSRFRGSISSNEVKGMTTELELLNSLCIRYINLSYRARPIYTSLAFVSKTFPLIFFQIYIYIHTHGFGLFPFRIVSSTLRNIWRQLCFYLVEDTRSRSWNVYIEIFRNT